MLRIALFMGTNIAVLVVLSIMARLFGAQYFNPNDLNSLLIMSAVIGFAGSFISLFTSKWMAKRSAGVQIIAKPSSKEEQWLIDTVQELAEKAGIKMPEVGIFPGSAPNAFATGWNKNDALVAVNVPLLQSMRPNEVRAVLGHEIAHVANGDMVTLTLIQGVVNTFVIFLSRIVGSIVDRAVFRSNSGTGPGYFITSMIAQVVLGLLASMIVSWFSRYREFHADEGGAEYADRESMIEALQALQRAQGQPADLPKEMLAFGIRPGIPSGLAKLFATHPPLDQRIAALQQRAT